MLRRRAEPEEIEPQISRDPVTGFPDRTNLGPWLDRLTAKAQAQSSRVALTFLGLGHFDDVTDTYDADTADRVLATIAQRLSASLSEGQLACHYHGSQFAVVTPDLTSVERSREISERLLSVISEAVPVGDAAVSTTVAAGVALSDPGYPGVMEWLRDAQSALTEARLEGHKACVVHDEATRNRIDVRVTAQRVLKGWNQHEFYLKYQPIVHTADGRIAGFEALLRWRDPGASGTFIGPDQFVGLLEQLGLSGVVGEWVLHEAASQLKTWTTMFADRDPMFVLVNLGARQIAHPKFAESVVKALDAAKLPPEQLILDITDTALRFNRSGTWSAVRDLKFLGVRLALDDFGTGEAGMSCLRDLQLDFVSTHRSFMQGLGHTKEDPAILRALVGLARELDLSIIAEGIETDTQNKLTCEMSPDYLQGYYYGRAELAANVTEMLETSDRIVGSEDWMLRPLEHEPIEELDQL